MPYGYYGSQLIASQADQVNMHIKVLEYIIVIVIASAKGFDGRKAAKIMFFYG